MPRECRNFNNVGKVSCLLLLLLTFLVVNPIANSSAFAEEDTPNNIDGNYFETSFDSSSGSGSSEDTDNVAFLDDTASTVNIAFSPASAATSLSPTTSTGQSAQLNVLATVSVQNSGGYSVYLKGNSINLVGQSNSSNYIPGATTAKTYTNMDTNTWGYYAKEGTTVPDTATYKAISVSGNGEKIVENTTKKIFTDTKNIMLSFAAKINDEKPADTYKNTITMSVISSPLQTTLVDITNMQDMTSDICTASAAYETKQLKDTRDGKFYWVTKLANNTCWMTQNLDLDLSTATTLTPTTSDVSANWKPGFNTATTASSTTVTTNGSQTETRSWSLGNYRITNPTASSSCGGEKGGAANCSGQFTAYNTPTTANNDANAHYILGNHYQWNAATAGTGGTIITGQASNSICPKGWRLPISHSAANGGFNHLINTDSSIRSDVSKLTSFPYYFVRGGEVSQNSSVLFANAGDHGYYWSSTPSSEVLNAYMLNFNGTDSVDVSIASNRSFGFSVRCVAR